MDSLFCEELAKMPLMKGVYVAAEVVSACTQSTAGLLCIRNVHYKPVTFLIKQHEEHGLVALPIKGTLDPYAMRFVRISNKDPKKQLNSNIIMSMYAVVIPDNFMPGSDNKAEELWKAADINGNYVQKVIFAPCSTAPLKRPQQPTVTPKKCETPKVNNSICTVNMVISKDAVKKAEAAKMKPTPEAADKQVGQLGTVYSTATTEAGMDPSDQIVMTETVHTERIMSTDGVNVVPISKQQSVAYSPVMVATAGKERFPQKATVDVTTQTDEEPIKRTQTRFGKFVASILLGIAALVVLVVTLTRV